MKTKLNIRNLNLSVLSSANNSNTNYFFMKKISVFLICLICSITVQAQGSMYKGSRTWETISSLMGLSVEKAKTILTSNGMVVNENQLDQETGFEFYTFIPANSSDPEYEQPFALIFNGGKVVAVYVQYAYDEDEEAIEKQDLDKIVNQLKQGGYTLENNTNKTLEGPFGETEYDVYYFKNKTIEARIYHDKGMATFSLSVGETKYQQLLNGDSD